MTSSATRQEQRTVTQQVKTTSTVVTGEQVVNLFLFFSFKLFLFLHNFVFFNYIMNKFCLLQPPFNVVCVCVLICMAYSWADETV